MHVIDSHTGGMPTRVILDGGPDLGSGPLSDRATRLADDHWAFCQSVLRAPRGVPGMVAALLVAPVAPGAGFGVIFFDADAVLGMCGHGSIGLAVTLGHLGRLDAGPATGAVLVDTPAGMVELSLDAPNIATVTSVESRRVHKGVSVDVPGHGRIDGDLAYGGNWFFIVDPSPIPVAPENIPELTALGIALRRATISAGLGGEQGEPVDHVIFQGNADDPEVHGRSFVLCPDDTYDRSPCGTGCSARLACLAADGVLAPGAVIQQESVIGSRFRLSYLPGNAGGVIPRITGQAHVMADTQLVFQPSDPFREGISL